MQEQLQKILERVLDWWKKFNNKQRIMIGSAVGVVLIALVILAVVMATPNYIVLYNCENYSEAANIKEILEADGTITYKTSDGGLVYWVTREDEADACMLLATNDFSAQPYSIENVVSGSFTQTQADKQKLYQDYLEKKFADHIMQLIAVEDCRVVLTLPEDDGTIIAREEQAKASVHLTLKDDIDSDQAYALAQYIATSIGNDST